ncbi:VCBS repeat-containing protein, partial [bacterium]|nr:VCBS repeat-containing protein [bacterium]
MKKQPQNILIQSIPASGVPCAEEMEPQCAPDMTHEGLMKVNKMNHAYRQATWSHLRTRSLRIFLALALVHSVSIQPLLADWQRHTIDATSQGADGVRLADVNGDALLDIATGWEEGGKVRVYLNPGRERVTLPWPKATVGEVASPEDAVFIDMNADGVFDVVSSCEGKNQSVYVHWAPPEIDAYLDSSAWKTEAIPGLQKLAMWMFAYPARIDSNEKVDLVLGSKGDKARLGWLKAPGPSRGLEDWKYVPLYDVAWIMSIVCLDADQDGDQDILISDRKGSHQGIICLENPLPLGDPADSGAWKHHRVGPLGQEVMFLHTMPSEELKGTDVWVGVKPKGMVGFSMDHAFNTLEHSIRLILPEWMGTSKGVAQGDINKDGQLELVISCEGATRGRSGLAWCSIPKKESPKGHMPIFHDIAGSMGVKFDRIELLDLDEDG